MAEFILYKEKIVQLVKIIHNLSSLIYQPNVLIRPITTTLKINNTLIVQNRIFFFGTNKVPTYPKQTPVLEKDTYCAFISRVWISNKKNLLHGWFDFTFSHLADALIQTLVVVNLLTISVKQQCNCRSSSSLLECIHSQYTQLACLALVKFTLNGTIGMLINQLALASLTLAYVTPEPQKNIFLGKSRLAYYSSLKSHAFALRLTHFNNFSL